MAAIGADFVSELTSYVNGNIDDFVWQGYSVYAYGSNGSRAWGLYCDALSEADKKYEEYKLKYPQVRLWDMENRELLKDSLLRKGSSEISWHSQYRIDYKSDKVEI